MAQRSSGARVRRHWPSVWRCVLLLGAALALVPPATAQADGGIPLVLKIIPPYEVVIYATTAPLLANMTIDVSVLLVHDPQGTMVLDGQVLVRATPVGHDTPVYTFPATHAQATNKIYYAANVRLPAGRWQFVAEIRDGSWTARVPFQLKIIEPVHHHHFPIKTIALWLAVALVLGGAVLVAIRGSHRRSAAPPGQP